MKNPSEALENKRKASAVKEGLKDAYGEGQVNAAVKANTTSEKKIKKVQRFLQPKITKMSYILTKIRSEKRFRRRTTWSVTKTDPEQYRYKSNINSENENAFQIYQNEIKKYKRMRIPSICQMIMASKLELKINENWFA